MRDVEGKTAFITGGASGVGLGMAEVFLDAGMRVVIADIRRDHLDRALEQLGARRTEVHAIQVDVADRLAMAAAADEAEGTFGPVRLLCNNAGINLFRPVEECSYDDWDWLLGVNLGGVINGVQTFVPRMLARGDGGHIVNTASMAAFIAGPQTGIYNTSKFAVRGLTESLRWSLAPKGIGVSLLCPGLVRSRIYESDKIRPEALSANASVTDPQTVERLASVHQVGMDPVEVGRKVLEGVRENRLYIFPHPEFKDELRELFDEVLASIPDGEVDPQRAAFEEARRTNFAKIRAQYR